MKTSLQTLALIFTLSVSVIACGKDRPQSPVGGIQANELITAEGVLEQHQALMDSHANRHIKVKKFILKENRIDGENGRITTFAPTYQKIEKSPDLDKCEDLQRLQIAKAKLSYALNIGIHLHEISDLKEEGIKRLQQPLYFRAGHYSAEHQARAYNFNGAYLSLEVLAVDNSQEMFKDYPSCTIISAKEIKQLVANPWVF